MGPPRPCALTAWTLGEGVMATAMQEKVSLLPPGPVGQKGVCPRSRVLPAAGHGDRGPGAGVGRLRQRCEAGRVRPGEGFRLIPRAGDGGWPGRQAQLCRGKSVYGAGIRVPGEELRRAGSPPGSERGGPAHRLGAGEKPLGVESQRWPGWTPVILSSPRRGPGGGGGILGRRGPPGRGRWGH